MRGNKNYRTMEILHLVATAGTTCFWHRYTKCLMKNTFCKDYLGSFFNSIWIIPQCVCLTKGFLITGVQALFIGQQTVVHKKRSWFYRINAKQYWIIELSPSVDLKEGSYIQRHIHIFSKTHIQLFFTIMSSLVYRCPEIQYIYFRHKSDIHLLNGLFFCFYAKLKTNLGLLFIFDMTLLMIFISNYK